MTPAATAANKKFWQFKNLAGDAAELILYGDIADTSWWGDEVTPTQFKSDLDALGSVSNITVRINSGGGDVWAAQTIGNLLEEHAAQVTAHIDGLCASAATIVACHCNKVEAAAGTTYMIHPAMVGLSGYMDAKKLEQLKQALDGIRENILDLYEKKTGQSREDLAEWMDGTSWWTANEAKEKGFVDEVLNAGGATTVENRNGVLFVNSVNTKLPFDAAPNFLQDSAAAKAASGAENKTAPAGTPETSHEEGKTMEIKTVEDARKAFPDLVDQIEKNAGQTAAQAEQERLKAIDEVAKLFPTELVNAAKYGEKACDAKELAYRAALDSAKKGREFLEAREIDAQESGVKNVASVPPEDKKPGAANSPAENSAQGKKDAQAFLNLMEKGKVN